MTTEDRDAWFACWPDLIEARMHWEDLVGGRVLEAASTPGIRRYEGLKEEIVHALDELIDLTVERV
jgi:hypothetical protein